MTTRTHWPVVIVGAGPTGLTTANLLARQGIDVLIIERNLHTVQEPRAVSIDDESLRTMQTVGIINELLPTMVLGYGSEYYSPGGRRFLKVKPTTLEYGYPRRNAFRQPVLEAILRRHLSAQETATAWFGVELVEFRQSDAKVTLSLRAADTQSQITCDYLVACDGSRSFVRQGLQVAMQGATFKERWLVIDIDGSSDGTRDTKVYCNPFRPCLSLPGPNGMRRFEFMLHDGESEADALEPANVAALLRLYGRDDEATVHRKTVYTFHARMAERWRVGRVLLAGDAAHLMPPFAGQGMNSGIRDAHNLSWKIAAVVSGRLGSALLDTYETERRSHAAEMVELAKRMGHIMMPRTRLRAFALQAFFRAIALHPAVRDYFAEMKFKPKPKFRHGFLINREFAAGRPSLIGRLFPQALVATATGYQLLDDLLGQEFAVVAPPGTSPRLLEDILPAPADALPLRYVAALDREDASQTDDRIVTARDVRGDLAGLLRGHPPGLFVLRPDRYVCAFFPVGQIGSIRAALQELAAATWRSGPAQDATRPLSCPTLPGATGRASPENLAATVLLQRC